MKYVFPCIISQNQGLYSLVFPDLENRKVYCSDLYDLLKKAHNILLIELYIRESQRMVIVDPTPVQNLEIKNGQVASYVTCDTEVFENMLDLYDNIHTDDLERFLQERAEESEAYEAALEANEQDGTDTATPSEKAAADSEADAEAPSGDNFMLDYEEELEVKPQNAEKIKKEPSVEDKKKKEEMTQPKSEGKGDKTTKKRPYNNYRPRKR